MYGISGFGFGRVTFQSPVDESFTGTSFTATIIKFKPCDYYKCFLLREGVHKYTTQVTVRSNVAVSVAGVVAESATVIVTLNGALPAKRYPL